VTPVFSQTPAKSAPCECKGRREPEERVLELCFARNAAAQKKAQKVIDDAWRPATDAELCGFDPLEERKKDVELPACLFCTLEGSVGTDRIEKEVTPPRYVARRQKQLTLIAINLNGMVICECDASRVVSSLT